MTADPKDEQHDGDENDDDQHRGDEEDEVFAHGSMNKLGAEVAAQMEAIEQDCGENYEIGNVVTIVEVITPDGPGVRVRCNAPPWTGLGMLKVAERALEAQGGR